MTIWPSQCQWPQLIRLSNVFPLNNSTLYCQSLFRASDLGRRKKKKKKLCCKHWVVCLITVPYLCWCAWADCISVDWVPELIGGDLCKLVRDGWSDAANWGGGQNRWLPGCRVTLSALLVFSWGPFTTLKKRNRKRQTGTTTDPLDTQIRSGLAPL